jgi:predicted RNA binding protein YcfA (HicA-like mRNA interferase family)
VGLDYARLHGLTARELISALTRDGFVLDRQAGSHRLYLHQDGRRVTVSYHASGETFRRKTLKAMLELQANWTEGDLKRLRLVK